jgi:hypothetical protein
MSRKQLRAFIIMILPAIALSIVSTRFVAPPVVQATECHTTASGGC